jgi:hypothetical protein
MIKNSGSPSSGSRMILNSGTDLYYIYKRISYSNSYVIYNTDPFSTDELVSLKREYIEQ